MLRILAYVLVRVMIVNLRTCKDCEIDEYLKNWTLKNSLAVALVITCDIIVNISDCVNRFC